jgi:hypothetical protein
MHPRAVGLALTLIVATPAEAQNWQLTLSSKGDSMFTDLDRIDRISPHVYRVWSRYVFAPGAGTSDTEALVEKEYDCQQRSRRVFSAVFYNADRAVTWESKNPGPWIPVTRHRGRGQWLQVCTRVEGRVLSNFISWLKITLRGSTS